MATEDINIAEDGEMAECEGDKIVTMMDVLQEQQDFEEDANAVLGASDDKNCTYSKGYIKRQALYACLTCCPDVKTDPTKRAGVCLACSLNCHENHELVELYTKRNFRCDCGNPKFNSNTCQFSSNKIDFNNDNIYNQNFSGLYCTCHRPYPDPESTFEDDMIQCIICEDWLHASHLDAVVPANDQYSEMICKGCMEKNDFLHDYNNLAVNVETVDIMTVNGDHSDDTSLCNGDVAKSIETNPEGNTVVSNGDDVHMADEKEDNTSSNEEVGSISLEETRHTEEIKKLETDESDSKSDLDSKKLETNESDSKSDLDSGNKKTDSESTDVIESAEDDDKVKESPNNKDDMESEDQIEITLDTTENKDATLEDRIEETENKSNDNLCQAANEEKQNDDQSTNDVNKDNNATEDQLLNGSDNSLKEPKLLTKTEIHADENVEAKEENPADSSVKADNNIMSEDTEKSDSEQTNESSSIPKTLSVSECSKLEVPDTSQETPAKESEDDKTDEVMDAIDALLESSTEAKDYDSKNKEETEKTNDISENECKQPEQSENKQNSTTESQGQNKEIVQSDVEMADSISHDEVSAKENEVNNETVVDSGKNECVEMVDSISHDDVLAKETEVINETVVDSDKNECVEMADSISHDEVLAKEDEVNNDTVVDSDKNECKQSAEVTDSDSKFSTDDTDNIVNGNTVKADSDVDNTTESTNDNKRKLSITEESSPKKIKFDTSKCIRPKGVKKVHKGATFWPSNFRQKLCTCGECISMYKDLHVSFLTDLEDTVLFYESLGKENVDAIASQYEKGLQALSSLDRIQQINALTEYNKMRDKLLDFLKSFKDRKEIVKEEDIKAFFAGMKPRREPDGVYFCR